jgi:hypothetical protein
MLRPYKSRFFFAPFALFAANSPNPILLDYVIFVPFVVIFLPPCPDAGAMNRARHTGLFFAFFAANLLFSLSYLANNFSFSAGSRM